MKTIVRNQSVDVAKGFLMLLIIWEHYSSLTAWVHYSQIFVIPCFFFLSGVFFKIEKYPRFTDMLCYSVKNLYLSYLFFSLLTYIWFLVVEYHFRTGASFIEWYRPLMGIVRGGGVDLIYNGPLWFLPCLMTTMWIHWVTQTLVSRVFPMDGPIRKLSALLLLLLLYFTGCSVVHFVGTDVVFSWTIAIWMAVFLGLGDITKRYILSQPGRRDFVGVLLALGGIALFSFPIQIHISTGINSDSVLFLLEAMAGIIGVVTLSRIIGHCAPLEFVGRNSLVYLCLQYPVIRVLRTLGERIGWDGTHSAVGNLVAVMATCLILVPCVILYNRYIRPSLTKIL